MRQETKTVTYYKFDELSEQAQEKAIENLYHINLDHEWWDYICEDAQEIGCKIEGFDIDRGSYCELKCTDPEYTAKCILENHGEECDTYKLAYDFMHRCASVSDWPPFDDEEESENERHFIESLSDEFLSMLRREYEDLTSEEVVKETIECNNYEFDEEGNLL